VQDIAALLQRISVTHGQAESEKANVDNELLRMQRIISDFQKRIAQVRPSPTPLILQTLVVMLQHFISRLFITVACSALQLPASHWAHIHLRRTAVIRQAGRGARRLIVTNCMHTLLPSDACRSWGWALDCEG